MSIKAIETRYKGYRFRSRLEARWAVFFDALGLQWEYEPEGFDLGDAGWYLPDFYIPSVDTYIEIKGKDPTHDERNKCYRLSSLLEKCVVLVCGTPGYIVLDDTFYKGAEYHYIQPTHKSELYAGELWHTWKFDHVDPELWERMRFDFMRETFSDFLRKRYPGEYVPDVETADEGDIRLLVRLDCDWYRASKGRDHPGYAHGRWDSGVTFCASPNAGRLLVADWSNEGMLARYNAPLRSAAAAARSARFEHGECPA